MTTNRNLYVYKYTYKYTYLYTYLYTYNYGPAEFPEIPVNHFDHHCDCYFVDDDSYSDIGRELLANSCGKLAI